MEKDNLQRLVGKLEILPSFQQYESYREQNKDLNSIPTKDRINIFKTKDNKEYKNVKARISFYNKNIDQYQKSNIFSIFGNNRVDKAILYTEYGVTVNVYISEATIEDRKYYKLVCLEDCRKISDIEKSLSLFAEDQKK